MRYFSMFTGVGGFERGIEEAFNKISTQGQVPEQTNLQSRRDSLHDTKQGEGEHRTERTTCVGYSEIDKYAIQIFRYHYPDLRNFGDATKLNPMDIPDFDLLVGGFPCQAFSVAGKRLGFEDTRGTLFFEIARVLRAKRPRYFLLENVKGLLSHDNGRTLTTILATLDELRYDCEWSVLNASYWVPQNRERIFLIGHIRENGGQKVFPIGQGEGVSQTQDGRQPSEGERICSTIDSRYGALRNAGETYIKQVGNLYEGDNNSCAGRFYSPEGISPTLKGLGGGLGGKCPLIATGKIEREFNIQPSGHEVGWVHSPTGIAPTVRENHGKVTLVDTSNTVNFAIRNKGDVDNRQTYLSDEVGALAANPTSDNIPMIFVKRKRNEYGKAIRKDYESGKLQERMCNTRDWETVPQEVSNTVTGVQIDNLIVNPEPALNVTDSIRRLTPKECERLQGFEDEWTRYGLDEKGNKVEMSDTQRYKTLGNAVCTKVVEAIVSEMIAKGLFQ